MANSIVGTHVKHGGVDSQTSIESFSSLHGRMYLANNNDYDIYIGDPNSKLIKIGARPISTSVWGYSGSTPSSGFHDNIQATSDGQVLRRASGVLGFGSITSSSISDFNTAVTGLSYWTYSGGVLYPNNTSDNVSIGTSSNSSKLHVQGTSTGAVNFKSKLVASATNYNAMFSNYNDSRIFIVNRDGDLIHFSDQNWIISVANNYGVIFKTNDTNRFEIYNTGQIRFTPYGTGAFTGTIAKYLAVTSSGNLVESVVDVGSVAIPKNRIPFGNSGGTGLTSTASFRVTNSNLGIVMGSVTLGSGNTWGSLYMGENAGITVGNLSTLSSIFVGSGINLSGANAAYRSFLMGGDITIDTTSGQALNTLSFGNNNTINGVNSTTSIGNNITINHSRTFVASGGVTAFTTTQSDKFYGIYSNGYEFRVSSNQALGIDSSRNVTINVLPAGASDDYVVTTADAGGGVLRYRSLSSAIAAYTPTLQQVTTAGNTTTDYINVKHVIAYQDEDINVTNVFDKIQYGQFTTLTGTPLPVENMNYFSIGSIIITTQDTVSNTKPFYIKDKNWNGITNWRQLILENSNISLLYNDSNYATQTWVNSQLPTVNNSTITLKNGGTTIDSFTLNQASNKNIDLSSLVGSGSVTLDEYQIGFGNSSDELTGDDSFIRYATVGSSDLSQTIKATRGANVLHNNEGGAYAEWNKGGWFNVEEYAIDITSVLQNINSAYPEAATGWGTNTYFHIVVDFVLTDGTRSTTGTKHYQVRVNSGTFTIDNNTSISAMAIGGSTANCSITTTGSTFKITLASTSKGAGVYYSVTLKVTSISFTAA